LRKKGIYCRAAIRGSNSSFRVSGRDRRTRAREPDSIVAVFLALGVHALHEVLEFGVLLERKNGADFVAALLADRFVLRVQGSVERAPACARVVNDAAELLLLLGVQVELAW
jgi:hypothetical protein